MAYTPEPFQLSERVFPKLSGGTLSKKLYEFARRSTQPGAGRENVYVPPSRTSSVDHPDELDGFCAGCTKSPLTKTSPSRTSMRMTPKDDCQRST